MKTITNQSLPGTLIARLAILLVYCQALSLSAMAAAPSPPPELIYKPPFPTYLDIPSDNIRLTVPPAWQVIPEDNNYPSDDVVVATLQVSDKRLRNPLPANPAGMDCTATFQDAIDQVWAAGGGTVFVPAGEYLFRGELLLRERVALRGRWQYPTAKNWQPGTVLKIAPDNPQLDGTPFLNLEGQAGVQELTFWYPEQRPNKIIPYPFAIYAAHGGNTIQDITFVNAYRGLNAQNAAMSVFRGIYGTALETGMIAGHGVAFPRLEVTNLAPDYWQWWPLDTAIAEPAKPGNYAHFMLNQGIGFRLREMDGCNWFHADISGYSIGLVTEDDAGTAKSEPQAPHGIGIRINIHGCRTAMRIRRGGMTYQDSRFEGSKYAIAADEHGSADFVNSRIVGGQAAVNFSRQSTTAIGMKHCEVKGVILAEGKNQFNLRDCDFTTTPEPVLRVSSAVTGKVFGCHRADAKLQLPNIAGIEVDPRRSEHKPLPAFGLDYRTDWNRVRKPAKAELFNVTDARFAGGAKGDGKADDTEALRAALHVANANGGGIVFLPSGYYRLTAPLDLGRGVELRGAAGTRHCAGPGEVAATDQLMSVLVIAAKGPADGTPLLTLGDGCGVRHLLFFYPEQNWKRLMVENQPVIPYPFTIYAHGKGNYVINCSSPNPYQFVDFNGAEGFLSEFCLTGGIRHVYRVRGGARNGRIQTGHIKPAGFWGGLTDIPNSAPNRGKFSQFTTPILEAFVLRDCADITLSGIFARTAHRVLTVDRASGRAILIGGEQLQNGFVFERAGDKPFYLIDCGVNAGKHGNDAGKHAILLEDTFQGKVEVFGGHFAGTSDYTYRVKSGELYVYDGDTPNYGYRAPRSIEVANGAKLHLERCGMSREWSLNTAPGAEVVMHSCDFSAGFPAGPFKGGLDLHANHNTGKLILSAPGQLQFDEHGIELDRAGTERARDDRSWSQRLVKGNAFRLNVTHPDFIKGRAGDCRIVVTFYTEAPCQVAVSYNSASGRQAGDIVDLWSGRRYGRIIERPAGFHTLVVEAKGTNFSAGADDDIRVEFNPKSVGQARPGLTMVSVLKPE